MTNQSILNPTLVFQDGLKCTDLQEFVGNKLEIFESSGHV